jgi:hypothetical protein
MAVGASDVPFGSEVNRAEGSSWNPVVVKLLSAFRTA